jgi:hypothetical protein
MLNAILSLPYVAGVAHYQNWSTLEIAEGRYNWTVLDAVFAAAARFNKKVILGLQMGVCAPEWVLDLPDVSTVSFVPANLGWFAWATKQSHSNGVPVITYAKPWFNPAYDTKVEATVNALAARFASHSALAWVNVAGISASAGVEANFNVNYLLSRNTIPHFDKELNYSQDQYVQGWKRRIDLYVATFPGRVGMAIHNQPGSQGWHGNQVVSYSVEEQMNVSRTIRDYLIAKGTTPSTQAPHHPRPQPVIRCCGGSNNTRVWGVPNVTVGPHSAPPGDYAKLMWEVRSVAAIGFEPAKVTRGKGGGLSALDIMFETDVYYNGRYLELKTPDLINGPGGETSNDLKPYQLFVPELRAVSLKMKGCCLPWSSRKCT